MVTLASILGLTQVAVEQAISDPKDLAKLTDTRHRGSPYSELIADAMEFAAAWVLSAAGVQVDQASLVGRPDLVLFRGHAAVKAAVTLWRRRSLGDLPESLKAQNAEIEAWADKYVERKRTPALDPEGDPAHPLKVVDFDPDGVKFTRDTLKNAGFW